MALLVLFLAEPTLELRVAVHPKPWLWFLFDGSQSMAIEDEQLRASIIRIVEEIAENSPLFRK